MRKKLNAALLGVFGSLAIAGIYSYISSHFGAYDQTANTIVWTIFQLIACISLGYIVFNSELRVPPIAKTGASISGVLFAIYVIANIISLSNEIYILSFMGSYASLVCEIITATGMIILLLNIKTWLTIKVVGCLTYLPAIISSCIYPLFDNAWANYEETGSFEAYDNLLSILGITGFITVLMNLSVSILLIVWMNKKARIPSLPEMSYDAI